MVLSYLLGLISFITSSRDGTVRVWDCHTGHCSNVINLGCEVGCLISEGSWISIGTPNIVKAKHATSGKEVCLEGPVGQVHAMITRDDMLFAGAHDGAIYAWKSNLEKEASDGNPFEFVMSLQGHTKPVVSLAVGKGKLYSGSMDGTIRVWDEELNCIGILIGHSAAVISPVCWTDYMLSCSVDQTVLVWAAYGKGGLEVIYTHREKEGIPAMFGMVDTEGKPMLCCSCNDKSVRLYELPSFVEQEKIFANRGVCAIHQGSDGLFFTSDMAGVVTAWKWQAKLSKTVS